MVFMMSWWFSKGHQTISAESRKLNYNSPNRPYKESILGQSAKYYCTAKDSQVDNEVANKFTIRKVYDLI